MSEVRLEAEPRVDNLCFDCGNAFVGEDCPNAACPGRRHENPTISKVAASLPTDPEDERLIDDLMAKRAGLLKVTPMRERYPGEGDDRSLDCSECGNLIPAGQGRIHQCPPQPRRFTAPEPLPVGARVRIVELGSDHDAHAKVGDIFPVSEYEKDFGVPNGSIMLAAGTDNNERRAYYAKPAHGGTGHLGPHSRTRGRAATYSASGDTLTRGAGLWHRGMRQLLDVPGRRARSREA